MDYPVEHFGAPPWATYLLIITTGVFSLLGFNNRSFERKYIFSPRFILADKEYFRLISSAFLHSGFTHLLFNMVSLYSFGVMIEMFYGRGQFLLIYFASVIGGSLLSLWLHRHHDYLAYGASGGVCGVIFAHIALFPGGSVNMFFIPFGIPGWAYAIGFLIFSFFALKAKSDNVGHDAHLGGAIIGLLTAVGLHPSMIQYQPITLAVLLVMSVGLFVYFYKNPMFLPLSAFIASSSRTKRSAQRTSRETALEIDRILEKISKHGLHSLKEEERQLLNQTSEKFKSRATSKGRESDLVI